MTITEKELARKLSEAFDGREWKPVVDIVKEVTGHKFATEKPEPGTWHVVKDGPQAGLTARVDSDGYLQVIDNTGKTKRDIHPDNTWPALAPARVVPEAEWESLDAARVTLVELDGLGVAEADRAEVLEQAARLVAHGITSDEVTKAVRHHYAPAEPVVLTSSTSILDEAQMQEDASVEWAAYRKDYGPKDTATAHKAFHAGYRAALATHGHGRAEVTREWLRNGIAELRGNGYGLNGEVIDIITDAVMDLLGGGDRG